MSSLPSKIVTKIVKRLPNCCVTTEVKLKPKLRVGGFVAFVFGAVSLGINAYTFSVVTNYHYGAWWGSMFVVVAGILGAASFFRGFIVAACAVSVVGIVMCLAGMIVDAIGAAMMNQLYTCASTENYYLASAYKYYGDKQYISSASYCVQLYYTEDRDCYCVNSNSDCYFFEGEKDCNVILGEYTQAVRASLAFDIFCFIVLIGFSVITCCSLCCPYGFRRKETFESTLGENDRSSSTKNPIFDIEANNAKNTSTPTRAGLLTRMASTFTSTKNIGEDREGEGLNLDEVKAKKMTATEATANPMAAKKKTTGAEPMANPMAILKAKQFEGQIVSKTAVSTTTEDTTTTTASTNHLTADDDGEVMVAVGQYNDSGKKTGGFQAPPRPAPPSSPTPPMGGGGGGGGAGSRSASPNPLRAQDSIAASAIARSNPLGGGGGRGGGLGAGRGGRGAGRGAGRGGFADFSREESINSKTFGARGGTNPFATAPPPPPPPPPGPPTSAPAPPPPPPPPPQQRQHEQSQEEEEQQDQQPDQQQGEDDDLVLQFQQQAAASAQAGEDSSEAWTYVFENEPNPYYWNTMTNETTFERPAEYKE